MVMMVKDGDNRCPEREVLLDCDGACSVEERKVVDVDDVKVMADIVQKTGEDMGDCAFVLKANRCPADEREGGTGCARL